MSIRFKLIISILLMSLVPLFVMGLVSYSLTREIIKESTLTKESQENITKNVRTLRNYSFLVFSVVAFIAIIISLYLSQIITDPIIKLQQFVKKMRDDKLYQITEVKSNDEIGSLAIAFNTMSKRIYDLYVNLEEKVEQKTAELSKKVMELESTKKELSELVEELNESKYITEAEQLIDETTMSAIDEAVVTIDAQGKIIRISKKALNILDLHESVVGKKYIDVFKLYDRDGNILPEEKRPIHEMSKRFIKSSITYDHDKYYLEIKEKQRVSVTMVITPIILETKIIGTVVVFKFKP